MPRSFVVVPVCQLASNQEEEVSLGHILERAGNGEEAREAKKREVKMQPASK